MKEEMKTFLASISGVRGVVGEGLTPDTATRFAAAFGTMMNKQSVVLGRDSRTSGEALRHAALAGLISVGSHVLDLGLCPTPTVQLMAEGKSGGLVITASHNPAEWNGLKFIGPDGLFLNEEQSRRLHKLVRENGVHYERWDRLGTMSTKTDALERHIDTVLGLSCIDVERIRAQRFRVVIDGVNGAGSEIGPNLLRRLGCDVVELYCQPDGLFPRNPEPVPEHLGGLCGAVKSSGAHVGFALDPDGDRLSIVSEQGQAIGEEYTLALATRYVLSQRKGPVVVNLSTSRMVTEIAMAAGVEVLYTPVGEINVAQKMREVGSPVGGEGNGGVILPEAHYGRDAFVGMALILQAMSVHDVAISDFVRQLPCYIIVKKKIPLTDQDPRTIVRMIAEQYRDRSPDLADGVKVDWPDRWVQVRASNTEPVVRVIAEAPTHREALALCEETVRRIQSLPQS